MNKIFQYVIIDILKNKIVLTYTILLGVLAWSTFSLEDNASKGLLTLLNLILLVVPLVAVLFSTIYIYNSNEFIELLVSHPIKRQKIWWSLFGGLAVSLAGAFLLGAGVPLVLFAPSSQSFLMLAVGLLTTLIFVALAFLSAILSRDKAKGIGIAILLWLFFALLFDGLVLLALFQFADYPIEKVMVGVAALNPLDLARILILLQLDVAALLGYTGAIFKNFFGTTWGLCLSFALLLVWVIIPFAISLRRFKEKDL